MTDVIIQKRIFNKYFDVDESTHILNHPRNRELINLIHQKKIKYIPPIDRDGKYPIIFFAALLKSSSALSGKILISFPDILEIDRNEIHVSLSGDPQGHDYWLYIIPHCRIFLSDGIHRIANPEIALSFINLMNEKKSSSEMSNYDFVKIFASWRDQNQQSINKEMNNFNIPSEEAIINYDDVKSVDANVIQTFYDHSFLSYHGQRIIWLKPSERIGPNGYALHSMTDGKWSLCTPAGTCIESSIQSNDRRFINVFRRINESHLTDNCEIQKVKKRCDVEHLYSGDAIDDRFNSLAKLTQFIIQIMNDDLLSQFSDYGEIQSGKAMKLMETHQQIIGDIDSLKTESQILVKNCLNLLSLRDRMNELERKSFNDNDLTNRLNSIEKRNRLIIYGFYFFLAIFILSFFVKF